MILKYIIIEKGNIPIIFPRQPLSHFEVAKNKGKIKSAGFCRLSIRNNEIVVNCFGNSSTLNLISNPYEDNLILESFIKKLK